MKRCSRIVRSLVGFAFLLTLCLLLCGHALAEETNATNTLSSDAISGTDGNIAWSVENGVLHVSGTGDMPDYEWVYSAGTTSYCTAPWYAHRSEISSVVVESGVTSLGTYAFMNMNISSVSLPSTLKTISAGALMCNGLSTVRVPLSVTSVTNAFSSGTQVIGLFANGTDGDTVWRIENGELRVSGSLPDYPMNVYVDYDFNNAKTPWHIYEDRITSIVVEAGITSIGRNAFHNCSNAASVTIPESVVSIGSDAFYNCGSVTKVDYRASYASSWPLISFENCYANPMAYSRKALLYQNGSLFGGIGALQGDVSAYAFYNCTNSFTVAASGGKISSVGDYAFYNCTGLTEAGMPSSLTHVGKAAFKNCTSLSYTYCLFDGLTYIGDGAFMGCTALTSADMKVYMDSAITYFGENAFTGCTALKTVNLGNTGVLPDSTFKGCTALESVTLPETLAEIQDHAFYDCTSLKTINLPASLKSIGYGAFLNCSAIKSIVFSDSLDSIGSYAFENCSALQSISIPKSVYVIYECAFKGCPVLRSISFRGSAPAIITSTAFTGVTATVTYRPGSSWVNKQLNYGGTLIWSPLGGSCGDALWRLTEDGLLSITGSGTVQAGAWSAYADDIHQILIGDGITAIESRAFAGLPQVAKVSFAGTTTQIAADAFAGVTADVYWVESCSDMRDMCEAFDAPYAEGFGGTLNWRHPLCSISLNSSTYALAMETHALSHHEANEPDCLNSGNMEYWKCTGCALCFADELAQQLAQEGSFILPPMGHSYSVATFDWAENGSSCNVSFACDHCDDVQSLAASVTSQRSKEPDCVNPGKTEYTATVEFGTDALPDPENPEGSIFAPRVYTDKLTLADIPALGHTKVTLPGVEPTCTETGTTDYIFCKVCEVVLQDTEELPALGHTESVTVEALAPTCTEPGHTQQTSCKVCGVVLSASKPIEATGHKEVVSAEAVAPDCVNTGLTQEISCSVCKQVVSPAQTVPALGHTSAADAAVTPTCEDTGLTEGEHCSACGEVLKAQTVLPALGHTPKTDDAVPPTDRETGLTEGSHCSVCGKTLTEQKVIPANFTWEGDTVVAYNGSSADVVIPDSATALGNAIFKYNTDVRTVRVPDSIVSLGTQSFFGCTSLTDVWLPQGLMNIGAQTFYNVTARIHTDANSATAVALSYRGVPFATDDGMKLRYRVTSATGQPTAVWLIAYEGDAESLSLPESIGAVPLTQLQSKAFAGCTRLKEIWIPESVTTIAGDAFDGLADALVIRSAVQAYAKTWAKDNGFAWEHDRHVEEVLDDVNPTCTEDGLTEGLRCSGCGEILVAQNVIKALGHTVVVDKAVPPTYLTSGLTEGSHCDVCKEVLEKQSVVPMVETPPMLALPQALRQIEEEAFADNTFVCVVLPEECQSIGAGAFRNCAQLQYIEIPASVTDISDTAFDGCNAQLIIITTPGSAAESFAQKHGITCALVNDN